MNIYKKECSEQGVDHEKVKRIAIRIAKAMSELDDMNLYLFGGSWNASIRGEGEIILADMNECETSGGCGAQSVKADGFMRGEQ